MTTTTIEWTDHTINPGIYDPLTTLDTRWWALWADCLWRGGPDAWSPYVAFRGGEPVGVVMPLHPEGR